MEELARRPYTQAVKAREGDLPPDLLGQHDALCQMANTYLARDPLGEHGIEALVDEAGQRALLGYPREFEDFLPPKFVVTQPWKK